MQFLDVIVNVNNATEGIKPAARIPPQNDKKIRRSIGIQFKQLIAGSKIKEFTFQ